MAILKSIGITLKCLEEEDEQKKQNKNRQIASYNQPIKTIIHKIIKSLISIFFSLPIFLYPLSDKLILVFLFVISPVHPLKWKRMTICFHAAFKLVLGTKKE